MSLEQEIHYLNGYLHNVVNLLKYIKEDAQIMNGDTIEMLNLALDREKEILLIAENLKTRKI